MNAENLLNDISVAVANRPKSPSKKYALYELNGVFVCKPILPAPEGATLIGTFNETDLDKGFTQNQWSKILSSLAKLLKEKTT